MTGPALNREEIQELLTANPPLITGAPHPQHQLQPNGYDLTLHAVDDFTSHGTILRAGFQAHLPERFPIQPRMESNEGGDATPTFVLPQGPYLVTFTETINMPLDLIALVRPRSSLLRCGTALHTGVWDAGYSGQSQALLEVLNPKGITIQRSARIGHMVFIRMGSPAGTPYQGRYQGEGAADDPTSPK